MRNFYGMTILFSVVVLLSGCDQANKLYESVSSKISRKKATPPVSTKQDRVQTSLSADSKQPASGSAKNVLVRVGDWSVTIEEFDQRLAAIKEVVPEYDPKDVEQKKMVLQELINQQLFVQAAKQQGVDQNEDIQLAVEEFRRQLLIRQMATKLTKEIQVSDQEVEDFYNTNSNEFVEPGQWSVREIVVGSEEEANKLRIELYNGADFVALAKQKSISVSAENGGALGDLAVFPFPKMQTIVAGLDIGEVSNVFSGPKGFYIIKLENKIGGETMSFEKVKDDIKAGLVMLKQQEKIVGFLKEARAKTQIEINEKLLME